MDKIKEEFSAKCIYNLSRTPPGAAYKTAMTEQFKLHALNFPCLLYLLIQKLYWIIIYLSTDITVYIERDVKIIKSHRSAHLRICTLHMQEHAAYKCLDSEAGKHWVTFKQILAYNAVFWGAFIWLILEDSIFLTMNVTSGFWVKLNTLSLLSKKEALDDKGASDSVESQEHCFQVRGWGTLQ